MKEKLNKVIIPIAGLGTRMLPATKAIPKEMLPIINKPIIQYVVEEAVQSGFENIIFVTHSSKTSVENHFDTSFELEATLDKRVKRGLLKEIKSISTFKININSVRQGEAKGLGHAILCARNLTAGEPFAVMLPDMLIKQTSSNFNLKQMKKDYEENKIPSILLGVAKKEHLNKYGIVKLNKQKNKNYLGLVEKIIEKPNINKAPSRYFAVGRYIFNDDLMEYISKTTPDKSGEIQLTDAISKYIKDKNKVIGIEMNGDYFDCGNKLGYLIANIEFAKEDPILKKELKKYLDKI
tara:strand:+ start:32315 stop:33196 length:882 start_codon:yes stop_codon:yes gene_type:complete